MLTINGLNTFLKKTKRQRELVKSTAGEFTRRKTTEILRTLVLNTPQWSGNTAASWTVHTYASRDMTDAGLMPDNEWEELIFSARGPEWIGNQPAWKEAQERNAAAIASIRYNTRISIVNTAPYAVELATNPEVEGELRPGNFIPGDVMAVKMTIMKFNVNADVLTL